MLSCVSWLVLVDAHRADPVWSVLSPFCTVVSPAHRLEMTENPAASPLGDQNIVKLGMDRESQQDVSAYSYVALVFKAKSSLEQSRAATPVSGSRECASDSEYIGLCADSDNNDDLQQQCSDKDITAPTPNQSTGPVNDDAGTWFHVSRTPLL